MTHVWLPLKPISGKASSHNCFNASGYVLAHPYNVTVMHNVKRHNILYNKLTIYRKSKVELYFKHWHSAWTSCCFYQYVYYAVSELIGVLVTVCAVLQVVCDGFLLNQNTDSLPSLSVRCRDASRRFSNLCVNHSAAVRLVCWIFSHWVNQNICIAPNQITCVEWDIKS